MKRENEAATVSLHIRMSIPCCDVGNTRQGWELALQAGHIMQKVSVSPSRPRTPTWVKWRGRRQVEGEPDQQCSQSQHPIRGRLTLLGHCRC